MIIAGAGIGSTTTLLGRISHLVRCRVDPSTMPDTMYHVPYTMHHANCNDWRQKAGIPLGEGLCGYPSGPPGKNS